MIFRMVYDHALPQKYPSTGHTETDGWTDRRTDRIIA